MATQRMVMDKLREANVLAVGDIMLDQYWQGDTSRISPEAPVPVVHVKEIYEKAGGAGNVAMNFASLGAQATVLAIIGNDDAGKQLQKLLTENAVNCELITQKHCPTVKKIRLLSRHQQLIRADFEENFDPDDQKKLYQKFKQLISSVDAVAISDYAKGTLNNISTLIKAAQQAHVPVLVDPKSSDFSVYQGATLITPNYKEFIAAAGSCESEAQLVKRAQQLITAHKLGGILITRGADGMTLVRPNKKTITVPTRAQDVFDVTGAGDTVIAIMAMAIAAGYDWEAAMTYANAAASVVISKVGTATVSPEELYDALHQESAVCTGGVVNEETLQKIVTTAKQTGEKVVMTNGCFDLVHVGHIDYLQAAKSLGNILIVAVNDDDSVRRLKGSQRPINNLKSRMHILEALDAVDFVVAFSEDTPERIITAIMPDILVKGADYTVNDIAGAQQILDNGGKVKTIALTPDYSTSSTIKRIQGDGA